MSSSRVIGGVAVTAMPDWRALCETVGRFVDRPGDPFQPQTIVIPGAAHARSLSQHLAQRLGGADGVCTGIDFVTMAQLIRRLEADLLGVDPASDPWRSRGMSLALLDVLDEAADAAWFEPVRRHLAAGGGDRPGRRVATANRFARLLRSYLDREPALLARWGRGELVDPTGAALGSLDQWQARVWQGLVAKLASDDHPDPLTRRAALLMAIEGGHPSVPTRLGVVSTIGLQPGQWPVVEALGRANEVQVWQLQQVAEASGLPSPLASRYGLVEAAAANRVPTTGKPLASGVADGSTLLRALQADVRANRAPEASGGRRADGTVQVHACHGPDRQVEVLREVLCDLFESDPTLEPRDVVVLCPDLDAYAGLVQAAFCLDAEAGRSFHPGHRLRVQVADPLVRTSNPVLEVLTRVLDLSVSRATIQELVELLALPPVARRFGLGPDELDEATDLLVRANVHWGVDSATRQRFGVRWRPGTWLAGVERMLIGATLADSPGRPLGPISPLPQISTSELDLIGALAEVVSRVRLSLHGFNEPAPVGVWVDRLRTVLDLLVDVAPADAWQLNHALGELATLSDLALDRTMALRVSDVRVLVARLVRPAAARASFLNGSLSVAGLGELHALPHRVVVVLGLDDAHFPPRPRRDGDDLLTRTEARIEPVFDDRLLARQYLLDAVLAAKDNLVVITQGADPRSNQHLDPCVAVFDLLAACDVPNAPGQWRPTADDDAADEALANRIVTHHPLQPFDWSNFVAQPDHTVFSFDEEAAQGALARQTPPPPAPPAWTVRYPAQPSSQVDLTQLTRFYLDAAGHLLAEQASLPRRDYRTEVVDELPIELDGLVRYRIGAELLDLLAAGATPDDAEALLTLSGSAPPGLIGEVVVTKRREDVQALLADSGRFTAAGPPRDVPIDLTLGDHRIVDSVRAHGNQIVDWRLGGMKAASLLEVWLKLLACSASGQPPLTGVVVRFRSKTQHRYLAAPPKAVALDLLGQFLDLRDEGFQQVLPLPLETSAAWFDLFSKASGQGGWSKDQDPRPRAQVQWDREVSAGSPWRHFFTDLSDLLLPAPLRSDPVAAGTTSSRFEALTTWLWSPIVQAAMRAEASR